MDLQGRHIAFLDSDSVYNWRGRHVAWWYGDHIRNQTGKLAVFLRSAAGLGLQTPSLRTPPPKPQVAVAPMRPGLAYRPAKLPPVDSWATVVPF